MSISIADSSYMSLLGNNLLKDLMKNKDLLQQPYALEGVSPATLNATTLLTPTHQTDIPLAAYASSSSMMSDNYANTNAGPSRYLQANLDSFRTKNLIKNSEDSRVNALLQELGGVNVSGTFFPGSRPTAAGVRDRLRQIGNVESFEASERNLEENKKYIEKKVQEATAPRDANGNIIQSAVLTVGEENELIEVDVAVFQPLPEVSAEVPSPSIGMEAVGDAISSGQAQAVLPATSLDVWV